MKVKYFTLGLLAAILVIFVTGADTTKSDVGQWEYAKSDRQSDERLAQLKAKVESYGFEANVEGLW